jgi:hypothetical protein
MRLVQNLIYKILLIIDIFKNEELDYQKCMNHIYVDLNISFYIILI